MSGERKVSAFSKNRCPLSTGKSVRFEQEDAIIEILIQNVVITKIYY